MTRAERLRILSSHRPIRRWLYAGGTRQDRLPDPDAVVAALDLVLREMSEAGYRLTETHDVVSGYWFGLFKLA